MAVQFLDPLAGDMCVNLCGRQIAVPEQHLYDTQIGPMIQQMRGKGMAQGMWRQLAAETGVLGVAANDVPES